MSRALGIVVLIAWLLFLICDFHLHWEYEQSLARQDRTFGEMYGPANYFYPILKYGSCSLTILLVFVIWRKR